MRSQICGLLHKAPYWSIGESNHWEETTRLHPIQLARKSNELWSFFWIFAVIWHGTVQSLLPLNIIFSQMICLHVEEDHTGSLNTLSPKALSCTWCCETTWGVRWHISARVAAAFKSWSPAAREYHTKTSCDCLVFILILCDYKKSFVHSCQKCLYLSDCKNFCFFFSKPFCVSLLQSYFQSKVFSKEKFSSKATRDHWSRFQAELLCVQCVALWARFGLKTTEI